jgi:transposase InsO family protein
VDEASAHGRSPDVQGERSAGAEHERAVEFATLEWVDWFNNRRLFGPIGNIPPAEFEARYDGSQEAPAMAVGLT